MTLTILTKSKKQQLINWEIQSKGSFNIEANFHLSIFIIKVCEIYLLYTFKIRHSEVTSQNATLVRLWGGSKGTSTKTFVMLLTVKGM